MLDIFTRTTDGGTKFRSVQGPSFRDKIREMNARPSALLWPREHGAYGELLFPLVAALLIGRPGLTAWALCAAALGGFLAHEGFVVLAGSRGDRARREDGPRAWKSLWWFGSLAVAGAIAAAPGLNERSAWGAAAAVLLSGAGLLVAWRGTERSLTGELLAALALTSWCLPVLLAGGLPMHVSLGLWSIWFVVFALGTTAVESVIARGSRRSPGLARGLCLTFVIASVAAVHAASESQMLPAGAAWTLLPAALVSLIVAASPLTARHLRMIGWSMIMVGVLTLVMMMQIFGDRSPAVTVPFEAALQAAETTFDEGEVRGFAADGTDVGRHGGCSR